MFSLNQCSDKKEYECQINKLIYINEFQFSKINTCYNSNLHILNIKL